LVRITARVSYLIRPSQRHYYVRKADNNTGFTKHLYKFKMKLLESTET
jgi:hypothetical protein